MSLSLFRHITAMAFLMSALLGGVIYQIKHKVLILETQMQNMNREIIRTNENIHILKAEWGYLNQPKRLQALSQKYLQLRSVASTQIASYKTFPTLLASRQSPTHDRVIIAQKARGVIAT